MIEGARWPILALAAMLGACGSGDKPSTPLVTLATFQNASVVIGQADFVHSTVRTPAAADTVNAPFGRVLVGGGKLYLPDSSNHRLLVYDTVPAASGAAANIVLGQPSFETVAFGTGAAQFQSPRTVLFESGRLLVADTVNSRIALFNSAPATSGAAADLAIGWDGLSGPASGCAQNRLNHPTSVFAVKERLLVADSSNNRVLIWNKLPTKNDPADLVLGQSDFAQCNSNAGRAVDGATLNYPTDVWSDGTRLVVVDSQNDRVLIWNSFPTANGAAADLVLGQADLASTGSACSQTRLASPRSVTSNGTQLFVAEFNNNRVLGWSNFPVKSGVPADLVLGQGSFTRCEANDDNQSAAADVGPTARTLNSPSGVSLWGKQLFVTDTGNNRYLIFNGQ